MVPQNVLNGNSRMTIVWALGISTNHGAGGHESVMRRAPEILPAVRHTNHAMGVNGHTELVPRGHPHYRIIAKILR